MYNSERSDECIDYTMIITSRSNAPISNFGGGFRWKNKNPWCIIEVKVKSKHFPTVFKKIEKKKMTEKREFIRKTSFRPNRFFIWLFLFKFLRNLSKTRKFANRCDNRFLRDISHKLSLYYLKRKNICTCSYW
ncbi:Uncharacterized protein FWK35_00019489 [Aphis craccivora]|uniref:Uncharacterized protein n=1 Tax=Aphis craccivora TaxID=307492 RepID=A0A6G0YB46_APHCR|nr:Uncharacterized protein FWK35_00019489 [Aphis craccivora]